MLNYSMMFTVRLYFMLQGGTSKKPLMVPHSPLIQDHLLQMTFSQVIF